MTKPKAPIALLILDGWGFGRENDPSNAINAANTPHMDALFKTYPNTRLSASGGAVGLPDGQMGNSEVGHLNIGAGRIVYQELTRITKAIKDGEFFTNPVLLAAADNAKKNGSALHLMGLLSDGGVHSHNTHLYALLRFAKEQGIERVYVHAFLDGRDVPPSSAVQFAEELEQEMASIGVGKIATIAGRYYAMDRDKRWERVEKAYRAMVCREGEVAVDAKTAIETSYAAGTTDEFVLPTVIDGGEAIAEGDSVIFFNFRPDRARQLTRTFCDASFDGFVRPSGCFPLYFATMTQYEESLEVEVAYRPQYLVNTLGETIAKAGLKQLRIAETEKYAHVTFFFNGGNEEPSVGEDRILVPSPKVATYDLQPEMSAYGVTEKVLAEIEKKTYDFIILNFANGDMVGHTGVFEAAVKAVETVDECVGKVADAMIAAGGIVCVTADHGNADQMIDAVTGEPFTAHTTNQVPFIVCGAGEGTLSEGKLADIAPTMLGLVGMTAPDEMTGINLFQQK